MSQQLYQEVVPQMSKMLGQLDKWLQLALEASLARSFDVSILLHSRLAPDQYPLLRQVQAACDQAKFAAARITGKDPPKHPDTEVNLEEARERIEKVCAYLATFTPADFEGAEKRVVPLVFAPGKGMLASDYLHEMALPNFYFHLTTAYAILRHNGVELGKRHYLGTLTMQAT